MREGYKETSVGFIPEDWECVSIGDISESSSLKNKDDKDIAVLSCTKYDGLVPSLEYFGKQIFSDDVTGYKVVKKDWFAYATNHIEEGSIGVQDFLDEGLVSPMYTVFYPTVKLSNKWFYSLLKSHDMIQKYRHQMSASVDRRGSLRWPKFSKINIPLPPLKEQEKIASILTTVDDKIESIDKQIESATELKKGLMQKLFQEGIGHSEFKDSPIGRIPAEWDVKKILDTEISIIDGDRGVNYPKSNDFLEEGYCLFLNAKNVSKNGFRFDSTHFISEKRDQLLRNGRVEKGDIIITTRGSVGHIAYNSNSPYEIMRINSGMVILRNSDDLIDFGYLYTTLRSIILQKQIDDISSGSAQPQLTVKGLYSLKLPIPPIQEQKQITNILTCADDKIAVLKEKREAYTKLKKGLMQKLLTGEVRVKVDA